MNSIRTLNKQARSLYQIPQNKKNLEIRMHLEQNCSVFQIYIANYSNSAADTDNLFITSLVCHHLHEILASFMSLQKRRNACKVKRVKQKAMIHEEKVDELPDQQLIFRS